MRLLKTVFVVLIGTFSNMDALLDSARTGWSMIEVSPNAYLSLVYHNFRVSIYKKQSSDPNVLQFYYSPALILDANSSKASFNPFTRRDEVTFKVLMWDDVFEKAVQAALARKLGKPVELDSIRILPIEEIRIDSSRVTDDFFELDNQWTSYANQPSTQTFWLACNKEHCAEIAQNIKDHPATFLANLVVHYSLQTQTTERRSVVIKAQHVRASNLYDHISQSLFDHDTVFLTLKDVKQLTLEVASRVTASEVTQDHFVSQDQTLGIARLVESSIEAKNVSTASFTKAMWNAVFWNPVNGVRPDVLTAQLNDEFNQSDSHRQEAIKRLFDPSLVTDNEVSPVSRPFARPLKSGATSRSSSQDVGEQTKKLITEARRVCQWSEGKFTTKPLALIRINLAVLRSNVIGTAQVTMTRASSELSTRINILEDQATLQHRDRVLDSIREELSVQNKSSERMRQEFETALQQKDLTLASIRNELTAAQTQSTERMRGFETILLQQKAVITTGLIVAFWGTTLPGGWLPCDGSPVSATLYPELHRLTGGSTPDLRDRFLYGAANDSVGLKAGEATHTLTVQEMPSHKHSLTSSTTEGSGFYAFQQLSYALLRFYGTDSNSVGGSEAHNNMPPYITVKFLIKT